MKWLPFLLICLFSFHNSIGQLKVENDSAGSRIIKKTIVVTLDSRGNYFINTKKVDSTLFDSSLVTELGKVNPESMRDGSTVIINADSSVSFGKVYHVMQLAKRLGARVACNLKLD